MSGQALVEAALVFPLLMLMLLGMVGVLYLDISVRSMQNGVDVLAELAARGPDWVAKVPSEDARTRCNADPLIPEVTYPDTLTLPGNRVLLTWRCHLETGWMFDGLPVTVTSEAVIEGPSVP